MQRLKASNVNSQLLHLHAELVDVLPGLAAVDAAVQHQDAAVHEPVEYLVQIDLAAANADDFVAQLSEQLRQPFPVEVIEVTQASLEQMCK